VTKADTGATMGYVTCYEGTTSLASYHGPASIDFDGENSISLKMKGSAIELVVNGEIAVSTTDANLLQGGRLYVFSNGAGQGVVLAVDDLVIQIPEH